MDVVELGRKAAATLHDQAIAAGHDWWQPYAFAVAEANRRGFDVEGPLCQTSCRLSSFSCGLSAEAINNETTSVFP